MSPIVEFNHNLRVSFIRIWHLLSNDLQVFAGGIVNFNVLGSQKRSPTSKIVIPSAQISAFLLAAHRPPTISSGAIYLSVPTV